MRHLYLSSAVIALTLTASVFAPICANAQNADTDQDIISLGQRIGSTHVDQLTAPHSTINAMEIKARGAAYLSDLLRTLPGASVNRSGPAGGLTQLRLRGSEANHTLVLIDGIEVSNPNTGEFDFAHLRATDIVKIEMLRGEQSALWGADAIGGVINIITNTGNSEHQYRASIEAGSFGTVQGHVATQYALGDAALSLSGTVFNTDGYDVSGQDGEKDGSKSNTFRAGLTNLAMGVVTVNANFSYQNADSEYDSDTNYDGRLNNTNAVTTTDTLTARIGAGFDALGFENQINASLTDTDQTSKNVAYPNDTTGKRYNANWAAKRDILGHTLTLLAETEEETFSNFGGIGAGQNQKQSVNNHAIAGDFQVTQHGLSLNLSARQDFNSRFDDAATWRVGAGYGIDAINGRVRASYGKGVKNPSMTELFGYFPAFFVGNPELKPEHSKGFNIGYDQKLLGDALRLSVDYFKSDLENEIFTDFSAFPSTARNADGKSKREGVEVEAVWSASDALGVRASASFLDTEENGVEELRRPDFLAAASVNWQATDALSLSLGAEHTGEQIDTDFGSYQRVTLDSYTLIGANVRWDITDQFSAHIRADNLLDDEYQEVVGYASQGRGIYAGLSANF